MNINEEEKKFLISIGVDGVLRIFLSTEEIKMANKLVKRGLLERGQMTNRQKYTYFYLNGEVNSTL